MPGYSYEPLLGDDIRLLHLLSGEHSDEICINIVHVPLVVPTNQGRNDVPARKQFESTLPEGWKAYVSPEGHWHYEDEGSPAQISYSHPTGHDIPQQSDFRENRFEALSYTWGDKTQARLVPVTSEPLTGGETRSLSITESLYNTLAHLRHSAEKRILWIDAVCINQNDVEERNRQVLRMRHIYAMASRVIVWLGSKSDDSDLALDLLQYLGNQVEITQDGWRSKSTQAKEEDWYTVSVQLPYSQREWIAITNLFQRPWFYRLWTLQEIAVARPSAIIRCGQHAVTWSSLRRAIILLHGRQGAPLELMPMVAAKNSIAYGITNMTLQDVLSLSRNHFCAELRDHIYGVLSFFGTKLRNQIQRPDYRRPLRNIFKDVFIRYSESTQRLDLLTRVYPGIKREWPSWVVSWESFPNAPPKVRGYRAAGMSRSYFQVTSAEILEASGIILSSIASVNEDHVPDGTDRLRSNLHYINFSSIVPGHRYMTGEDLQDAWARTLIGDSSVEKFPESDYIYLDHIRETITSLRQEVGSSDTNTAFEELLNTRILTDYLPHVKILATADGRIGYGPIETKKGDQICLLLGVFTPLVIRPTENGCFHIVGFAYVHGVMDCEAFLGPLPQNWIAIYVFRFRRYCARFKETVKEIEQLDDPRLGELPSEWKRIEVEPTLDDPEHVDYFRHEITGEVINYDPRMSLESLERRGVQLQTIRFI